MNINIPEEKEKAIYESALNEFALKGYEMGSTNTIVKNAGISKGSLFKYFGNKSTLYIYVVDKAIKTLDTEIFNHADNLSHDMFERIIELTKVKSAVSMKYPRESTIMVESMKLEDKNIKKYITDKINYYYKEMQHVFVDGIDYSKFKEGIDADKVYEILTYISQGLQNKYMLKYKGDFNLMAEDIDFMEKDVFSYIYFIRDSAYK